MLAYQITAYSKAGGEAQATIGESTVSFDASADNILELPNPAELLLTSLAACILKNVERYSKRLKFPYRQAKITVHGIRNDNPPYMKTITYVLEIDTDIEERKLNLWHRNIVKFGTITNTLLRSTELSGEIHRMNKAEKQND